jgi:CrcB protein
MIKSILIAGTGGFIGTILRFLVSRYFQENTFSLFPWGTFTVNILGSLLIGVFYGMSEKGNLLSPDVRVFLTVGSWYLWWVYNLFIAHQRCLYAAPGKRVA